MYIVLGKSLRLLEKHVKYIIQREKEGRRENEFAEGVSQKRRGGGEGFVVKRKSIRSSNWKMVRRKLRVDDKRSEIARIKM